MIALAAIFAAISAYERLESHGFDPAGTFLAVLAGILTIGAVLGVVLGRDDL